MAKSKSKKQKSLNMRLLTRGCRVYRVLSHPLRLRIVELLMEKDLAVKELAKAMRMRPATVSQHLGLMRDREIVEPERSGNRIYYSVISPQAHAMINYLREHRDET